MIGMKPGGAPRESGRPRSYRVSNKKASRLPSGAPFPSILSVFCIRDWELRRNPTLGCQWRAKGPKPSWPGFCPVTSRLVVFLGRYPVLSSRGDWYPHETYGWASEAYRRPWYPRSLLWQPPDIDRNASFPCWPLQARTHAYWGRFNPVFSDRYFKISLIK